jgi:hypothetical protein
MQLVAFALTITKALQDQYKDLFNDTTILKGKSNYISTIDSNIDVELESLIMPKNILEDHRRDINAHIIMIVEMLLLISLQL